MQSGYYNAVGGMVTQFNRLDVISNNLANLNTNAFKRDDVVIGDYLRVYENFQEPLALKNHSFKAAKFINRSLNRVPVISEGYSSTSLGAFRKTENPLDFALSKENVYFAVSTPAGVRYTREGSFSVSGDGFLVTSEGYRVLSRSGLDSDGGILLDTQGSINVDKNGNISFSNQDGGLNRVLDSLAVVSFKNPRYLKKEGSHLYSFPEDKLSDRLELEDSGAVRQGFIEKSNVNPVVEMTKLIETNRLVDMYSKVLKTHADDLNVDAITKLAVRA